MLTEMRILTKNIMLLMLVYFTLVGEIDSQVTKDAKYHGTLLAKLLRAPGSPRPADYKSAPGYAKADAGWKNTANNPCYTITFGRRRQKRATLPLFTSKLIELYYKALGDYMRASEKDGKPVTPPEHRFLGNTFMTGIQDLRESKKFISLFDKRVLTSREIDKLIEELFEVMLHVNGIGLCTIPETSVANLWTSRLRSYLKSRSIANSSQENANNATANSSLLDD
uniref:Uncharacterized protein n=1 Tax=Trichuris muris TaxID=70415 RepID=A0A5S6Q7R5_TRIMR